MDRDNTFTKTIYVKRNLCRRHINWWSGNCKSTAKEFCTKVTEGDYKNMKMIYSKIVHLRWTINENILIIK